MVTPANAVCLRTYLIWYCHSFINSLLANICLFQVCNSLSAFLKIKVFSEQKVIFIIFLAAKPDLCWCETILVSIYFTWCEYLYVSFRNINVFDIITHCRWDVMYDMCPVLTFKLKLICFEIYLALGFSLRLWLSLPLSHFFVSLCFRHVCLSSI